MSNLSPQTIADIARVANVSKSTVSRALNDSPLIGTETKERVHAIARAANFQLNVPARQLSLKQSRTIAFVTHANQMEFSLADLFVLEIMGGIFKGLYANGYDMLVVHAEAHETEWAHQYLDSGRVDGFILLNSAWRKAHVRALVEMDAPFIAWGAAEEGSHYPSVSGDNFGGGKMAAEHLIRGGRRRIAFLGGPADEPEAQQRFAGYSTALQAAGLAIDPDLVVHGDFFNVSGGEAMRRLLEQAPDLDAVFANSDLMAVAAIQYLREAGRSVPGDVAVVGYDDLSIARFSSPPLTTVRQNIPLAGTLLAQNLVQFLQTGVATRATLPVELVLRESA